MSILSVATIQSANSSSDLTIKASNASGSQIVLYANGQILFDTLTSFTVTTLASSTANIVTLISNTANISNLSVGALYANGSVGTSGQLLQSNGSRTQWTTLTLSPPNFNTNINNQIGFLTTTTLTAAFTAPATADQRYIIHSIHATNISTVNNDLYLEIEGTEYANNTIAGNIPLPVGTSLEFLRNPKVLYPNDKIKTRSTSNNAIHILIAYEISTDTKLFGKGYHISTGNTTFDAYTATGNLVIESIQLTNYNSNVSALSFDATVQTVWVDSSNVVQGYFSYDLTVPNKSTIDILGAPKVLPSGHKIQVRSSQTDYVDVVISGKLI